MNRKVVVLSLAILSSCALGADTPPSGAALISNVFKTYSSAKSLYGTIHMTQSMGNVSLTIETALAYEAPSKLYLKQEMHSQHPENWLVTSDGTVFTYDQPNQRRGEDGRPLPRLMEAVSPSQGVTQDFRAIFRAAKLSLGDVDDPIMIAIGGGPELQEVKGELATVSYQGRAKLGDSDVNLITGDWRRDARFPASAKYEMYVTDDGQLKRFVRHQVVSVNLGQGENVPPSEVVTTWDLDLHVNTTPDEALFTVVK